MHNTTKRNGVLIAHGTVPRDTTVIEQCNHARSGAIYFWYFNSTNWADMQQYDIARVAIFRVTPRRL
jgi:hypothetical protein